MLYRFKSKASGDLLMVGPQGDQVLRAMGREPALRGIVRGEQLAAALASLRAAIEADEAARAPGGSRPSDRDDAAAADDEALSLRRRAWPMVDMLERAIAEGADIVWGV
jgi:hypothetical protein